MSTPKDKHCLILGVSQAWLHQIGLSPNQDINSVLIDAKKETNMRMNYSLGFIKTNGCQDKSMASMERYSYRRDSSQPLGDLVPTVLRNALDFRLTLIRKIAPPIQQ